MERDVITLYPGNWLYNAGVIGLLRILDFAGKNYLYEFEEDGVRLSRDAFENFEVYYFEYATRVAALERGNLNNLKKELTERKTKGKVKEEEINKLLALLSEVENRLKIRIFSLKGDNDWEKFCENLKEILVSTQQELEEVGKILEVKNSITNQLNCEKIFNINCEEVYNTKFASDYLGNFYFNKGGINNPKGGDVNRIKKFKEKYLSINFNNSEGDYVCVLCGRKTESLDNLSELVEGDFSILGISRDGFYNFYSFFNEDFVSIPMKCDICQLVLLCAFAGFNKKPWYISELDNTDYIFVNYPNLEEAYRVNNELINEIVNREFGILAGKVFNPYLRTLELVLMTLEKKTRWTLENILFVEIKTSPRKDKVKPRFVYFNIERTFAEIFEEFDEYKNFLQVLAFQYQLYNERIFLSTEVLKRLLQKKPILPIIFDYILKVLFNKKSDIQPIWSMLSLEYIFREKIKSLKGGRNMKSKEIYGLLKRIQEAGEKSFSTDEIDKDKRFSIAQRFLGLIRGGRKEDFYNELLRLYIVYEKPIPDVIVNILYENDVTSFQEKALAFLTGFLKLA